MRENERREREREREILRVCVRERERERGGGMNIYRMAKACSSHIGNNLTEQNRRGVSLFSIVQIFPAVLKC